MRGANVLHPMGFDAFGLPAEQYAVETGVHPRVTTERNVANYERQLRAIGLTYDWDRMLATTDPDYYRWTQWIFLRLFDSWFNPACIGCDATERMMRPKASRSSSEVSCEPPHPISGLGPRPRLS